MKIIAILIFTTFIFSACTERDHLKEDLWIEYQLEKPKITVKLPKVFVHETFYPDNEIMKDTASFFFWPNDNYPAISIYCQHDNFESWYSEQQKTVQIQNRQVFRETLILGQYEFEVISYTNFNTTDSTTYIGYAFLKIEDKLFDIHNQLKNDEYFLRFLKEIKATL